MVTTDHHNENTTETSAQDGAEFVTSAVNECGEVVEIEAYGTGLKGNGKVIEPSDARGSGAFSEVEMVSEGYDIVEAASTLSTKDRAELEKRYNKKSGRRYRPVLTAAHAYPYTDIMKRHASKMAERGCSVLPCRPLTFVDETGKKWNAKAPLTNKGVHDATDDVNQIDRWWHWSRYPDAFIGVPTGLKNGFWVLDVDPKNDGITELKKLEAKLGPLPETYKVKTPSGGYHYYFKMPDGIEIKNDATGKVATGIDVRGEGGYVIVPPSMRADGRSYEAVDNGFLPEQCEFAPPWLIHLVTSDGSKKAFGKVAARGWAHRILARKCEEIATTDEGTRNETLNKVAFHVGMLVGRGELDRGAAFDALVEAARKCGLQDDEARKTINSGLTSGSDEKGNQPQYPDWTKLGPRRDSLDNVRALLSFLGIELRYNEFASRAEMTGFKSYTILNDNAVDELWGQCHEFGFQPSQNHLRNSLRTTALENSFHPVRDYFDSLSWDGQKRLDTWLINYLSAEDSRYIRGVGAKILIAAVRRIYQPGDKFDQMIVFEGKQGTGKSTAVKTLAIKTEWFTDSFSLTDNSQKVLEQTEGKLIIEVSELTGNRKADVDHVKALLSRTHDRARKAYGYFVSEVPRQFIVIGTTNAGIGKPYLIDDTGHRRIWPVETGHIDLEALKDDIDQLWAEALFRYKAGESAFLPPELWEAAREEQEKRAYEDPWKLALEEELGEMKGKVRTSDVWTFIGKPNPKDRSQYDNNHLSQVMRELGWERKKLQHSKKLQYCYFRGAEPHREITLNDPRFGEPSFRVGSDRAKSDKEREY